MSHEPSKESTAARERWREELASHRQPWPEWDALEALVDQSDFNLVEADGVPFVVNYLASPADDQGNYVSHLILDQRQSKSLADVTQRNPVIPTYLPPLLDLKWESSLMISGGIASFFNVYEDQLVEPPAPIGPETLKREANLIQYLDPDKVEWPNEEAYCFQTNYCGSIFCLTASRQVVSFSANAKRFVPIGQIDDFVRYCVMSILEHRDWFRSFRDQYRIDEYKLNHSEDAGID